MSEGLYVVQSGIARDNGVRDGWRACAGRVKVLAKGLRVLGLLCLLLLAGCAVPQALIVQPRVTAPMPAPDATRTSGGAGTNRDNLATALAHAPDTTTFFAFTDWTVIKRVAGVDDLTSADSMDARLDFMLPLASKEQALASAFGVRYFQKHAETWGWDSTDLVWEANLTLDGPPLWVLRFRNDFDFAPVLARLEDRAYTTSTHNGVTLYHHDLDFGAEWMPTSEFAILNIAFLPEEKSFMLSSSPEAVTSTLDAIAAGTTLGHNPANQAVARALGEVGSAILVPDGCSLLDSSGGPDAAVAALRETIRTTGIRHAYDQLGFGYRVDLIDGVQTPAGIFAMHYADAAAAQGDLRGRLNAATNGNSLMRGSAYAELFEVIDGEIVADAAADESGASIVLRLHALDRPPMLFVNMIYSRDLLFAACAE